jgi:GntR family transcriptional regulator
MGHEPRSDVEVTIADPPQEVAQALELPAGEQVVIRKRRMYADNIPVQLATSYIPASIAVGTPIADVDSGPGGIISRMAELGYAQVRITETVRWRPPTEEERAFLRLDKGQAVAEIWHTGWAAEGRPVEIMRSAVPAWQWQFDYEWLIT